VTSFGVEKIPPVVTNPFTFDLAGAGFDQGQFVGGGIDNPATMFRLDTAGQGFDQGVFSSRPWRSGGLVERVRPPGPDPGMRHCLRRD
jgi:hypothetical protein